MSDPALRWSPTKNATDNYSVNGLNQYTSIATEEAGATTSVPIVHDLNGNVTTDHRGRAYVYSAENQLYTVREAGTNALLGQYVYCADGTRRYTNSQASGSSVLSKFYYDGDQEIEETGNLASEVRRRYVRLPGSVDEPFLMIDYTLDAGCTTAANGASACERWAHQNRLGSVVAVTSSTGSVVEKHAYGPYGEVGGSASGFPFRFTGQKLDADTGLYYYKARYYDSETGRFLQTDPIGYEDQINLYAYVGNDPVNGIDPTGEECTNADDGTTRCVTDDYDVSFETPEGFQNTDPNADDYHDYDIEAQSPRDENTTREWVKNNPVPAGGDPATPEGTRNNAAPGFAPVTSYTATNEVTGQEVVVNVTAEGHPLGNGVVIREVVPNADGTSTIRNMGEGNGQLQKESTVQGKIRGDIINNLAWRYHTPPPPR